MHRMHVMEHADAGAVSAGLLVQRASSKVGRGLQHTQLLMLAVLHGAVLGQLNKPPLRASGGVGGWGACRASRDKLCACIHTATPA